MRELPRDPRLADQLTEHIAQHEAVFWECAPVSRPTRDQPFRYVCNPSDAVRRLRPDPSAFRHHLRIGAATFRNLGGDAVLVAPGGAVPEGCAHLAAWARTAPTEERHALWSAVAGAVAAWWVRTDAPLWLSTSGLGVPWLHVRLDARPKYITHLPYRAWTPPRSDDD